MVGFLLGAAYFAMLFLRPGRAAAAGSGAPPGALDEILLVAGAAALAAVALLTWLFRRGEPSLGLSEAEIQFLFPGTCLPARPPPLRAPEGAVSRALEHAHHHVVSGRRGSRGFSPAPGSGCPDRHPLSQSRPRLHEGALAGASAVRRATKIAAFAVSGGALGVLVVTSGRALRGSSRPGRGAVFLDGLVAALRSGPLGPAPFAILAPFRWILAPLLAPTARAFFSRAPSRSRPRVLLYAWVALTAVRFEEATLSQASRRAERGPAAPRAASTPPLREEPRRRAVRPRAAGPARGRDRVEDLLAWNRTSLRRQAAIVASLAAALLRRPPSWRRPRRRRGGPRKRGVPRHDRAPRSRHAPRLPDRPARGPRARHVAQDVAPQGRAPRPGRARRAGGRSRLYGWGGIAIALAIAAGRTARAAFLGTAAAPPPASAHPAARSARARRVDRGRLPARPRRGHPRRPECVRPGLSSLVPGGQEARRRPRADGPEHAFVPRHVAGSRPRPDPGGAPRRAPDLLRLQAPRALVPAPRRPPRGPPGPRRGSRAESSCWPVCSSGSIPPRDAAPERSFF